MMTRTTIFKWNCQALRKETDQSFCVRGVRDDIEFLGCYVLTHPANAEKAKAKFNNGLLNIEIPIKRILKGKKIAIE